MPRNHRPIGIFDSGIGGLTVFAAIRRLMPKESLIYLGDTARVPYGTKSAETVARYAVEDAIFLARHDVKAIVIACNTASAFGIDAVAKKFDLPVLGVIEPGAASAVKATKNRRVGVIGTSGTVASGAYERAIRKLDGNVSVRTQACPLFVPLVEEGWLDDEPTRLVAERYLAPLKSSEIDTLVLACTHYPLLRPLIQKVIGPDVTLIDSAEATSRELERLLAGKGLLATAGTPSSKMYVTDRPQKFESTARRFVGDGLPPCIFLEEW